MRTPTKKSYGRRVGSPTEGKNRPMKIPTKVLSVGIRMRLPGPNFCNEAPGADSDVWSPISYMAYTQVPRKPTMAVWPIIPALLPRLQTRASKQIRLNSLITSVASWTLPSILLAKPNRSGVPAIGNLRKNSIGNGNR